MTLLAEAARRLPLPLLRRGKVREVYLVDDDRLLLVASDRVSAFDVVMAEEVPCKGAVLTQLSAFWFRRLAGIVPHHFLTASDEEIVREVPALRPHRAALRGRATLVRRTTPVAFECVVRGYLAGSAWAEYRERGTLAGEPLPPGLLEAVPLPEPLFSPATKAEAGHDENVAYARVVAALGSDLAARLRATSLALYAAGRAAAEARGILVADTKVEFGLDAAGELLLIDELLTPDSSRFWPAEGFHPGQAPPSFDKQPLRDFLAGLRRAGSWNGEPPPPPLPPDVVSATTARYLAAYQRLTGEPLPVEC